MDSRREFIKKAAVLAGSFGLTEHLPAAIRQALSIDPALHSTFMDAEHVVLLMQENRSFDHSFGSLKGVRGFNDPRAITLPNQRPVWLQSYKNGDTFAPFRMNIKTSNAAWTSYLPHSWENQIGARNDGKHDNWLEAKRSGSSKYKDLPLTLGYYTREDIPFYYAFADAFTICDQHFCSSITGTTTNRHFFWTGKCTPEKGAKPLVRNSDINFSKPANWSTFPEKLEKNGISWKIYQNELSLLNDISNDDRDSWLGNFTDNNLEWFEQYQVRFKKSHLDYYKKRIAELPEEIKALNDALPTQKNTALEKAKQAIQNKQNQLVAYQKELDKYNDATYEKLTPTQKALHTKAFQTNENDPDYHQTAKVDFEGQQLEVPKGDILHQFRKDVQDGTLPTISWLVAPQNFSDHPSAPMYGAWYVSEVLNILTKNPDVWKKTIFILNYDENDGYFDHIPPFVAPDPQNPFSGKTSPSFDFKEEYVTMEQELASTDRENATAGPVGLGYRVPLIIASPWTRGGWVNSEVCDITSTLQFLEYFLQKKFQISIQEDNISSWRRGITGNLTSCFRPYNGEKYPLPDFLNRNQQILTINNAKNNPSPSDFFKFNEAQIDSVKAQPLRNPLLAKQEQGVKNSTALPYELYTGIHVDKKQITLQFLASGKLFGKDSLNSPFLVYSDNTLIQGRNNWSFAAKVDEPLEFSWNLDDFPEKTFALSVYGPNGYYRGFHGHTNDPQIDIHCQYEINKKGMPTGNILLEIENLSETQQTLVLKNTMKSSSEEIFELKSRTKRTVRINNEQTFNWYDFVIYQKDTAFKRHFAGRVETGKHGKTDPYMGNVL